MSGAWHSTKAGTRFLGTPAVACTDFVAAADPCLTPHGDVDGEQESLQRMNELTRLPSTGAGWPLISR